MASRNKTLLNTNNTVKARNEHAKLERAITGSRLANFPIFLLLDAWVSSHEVTSVETQASPISSTRAHETKTTYIT
jgi:hypothetical protein